MRTLASLITLTLLAPAALADRAPPAPPPVAPVRATAPVPTIRLMPIDRAAVPAACKAQVDQATATRVAAAVSARIALAGCMAEQAVAPLPLCDCGASIAAVDAAIAPAIALLDDVIANADPAQQVIAQHAKGQLHAGLAIKLTQTLPTVGPAATEAEVNLRDVRAQALDAQLTPWRDAARDAFRRVVELAKAQPALATNRVVATAVRDSEQRLAAEVATR